MLSVQHGGILTFGEILLRFCPDTAGRWLQESRLGNHVGGAEANVATALAKWGLPAFYMTAMPPNFVSEQLLKYLQGRMVNTSRVRLEEGRLGLFYLTQGQDMKQAEVVFDRDHSSFARLLPGTIDWDEAFEGITWFHLSAIALALTPNAAAVCLEAVERASQRGITVSLDLNYRAQLWKYGKQPVEVIPEVAHHADLIMGNIWAAEKMLDIPFDSTRIAGADQETLVGIAESTSVEIMKRFPKSKAVANTFRFNYGTDGIEYYTTLYQENKLSVSHRYCAKAIVDRVGSGDCFMAGLIYGMYHGLDSTSILEFATAAAYAKLFLPGDATTSTVADIRDVLHNNEQQDAYIK